MGATFFVCIAYWKQTLPACSSKVNPNADLLNSHNKCNENLYNNLMKGMIHSSDVPYFSSTQQLIQKSNLSN